MQFFYKSSLPKGLYQAVWPMQNQNRKNQIYIELKPHRFVIMILLWTHAITSIKRHNQIDDMDPML